MRAQAHVLAALVNADRPLSIAEMAHEYDGPRGSIWQAVNDCEAHGWVTRVGFRVRSRSCKLTAVGWLVAQEFTEGER